jgi:hypothetical protein
MVFLVETHTAGFEDGMLLFFVNQVAAQASLFGNLPTDSAEEPVLFSVLSVWLRRPLDYSSKSKSGLARAAALFVERSRYAERVLFHVSQAIAVL